MPEPAPFSAEDFRRRVVTRLVPDRGAAAGDHLLSPDAADLFLKIEQRPAAVLVPVIRREPEATVLFTLRTSELHAHAGQISFPGGRIDPDDADPTAAALREAFEEIGLKSDCVETLGLGPDYLAGSGYLIVPVLALVRPDFRLALNPAEVADVFEVPLSFLMDPLNHRKGQRTWRGIDRTFFEMPFEDRHIWGITAGIVRVLYDRLYAEPMAEALP